MAKTNYPVPPTYALPIMQDANGSDVFNPIWLQWFLDLATLLGNLGASAGGIQHDNLSGLQGGAANQYYHLSLSDYNAVNGGTVATTATSITVGASPFIYHNTDGFDKLIIITGSLTGLSYSRDNVTFYGLPVAAGSATLVRGDYLKVSYLAAPTMVYFGL
jgi:hypothetical protein